MLHTRTVVEARKTEINRFLRLQSQERKTWRAVLVDIDMPLISTLYLKSEHIHLYVKDFINL